MAERSAGGRLVAVGAAALSLTAVLVPVASSSIDAAPRRDAPARVDVAVGAHPSVSADGRWLVAQRDLGERTSVFRTDRSTGDVVELTVVPDRVRSGHSAHPVVSADGCVVVVQTELALDVFRDDDADERWDVYRLVVPECGGAFGSWELVSADPSSGTARDDVDVTTSPTVSDSGAVVAYTHPHVFRRTSVSAVTVVDVTVPLGDATRSTMVPAIPVESPTTAFRYRGVTEPALSGNGRYLAFTADTTASDPLPGWGEGATPGDWATSQVYVWDRDDGDRRTRIGLVSARDGVPAAAGAHSPAISEDGSVVVFVSPDRSLVAARHPQCVADCPTQVYRLDRRADGPGVLSLVSAYDDGPAGPVAGDGSSWSPAVNVDASQVVFVSRAGNLVPTSATMAGDADDGDVLVAEVPLGTIRRATDVVGRGPVPAGHANPSVSATGRVLVFDTAVPGAFGSAAGVADRHVVAIVAAPKLSLAMLDFGTVDPGWTSDHLYVSVLNEGPGAFAPGHVRSTSPWFSVVDGGTCSRGLVVPAGGTCTVRVSFTPSTTSAFSGTLVVSEDDPSPPTPVLDPVEPDEAADSVVERAVPAPVDPMVVETRVVGAGGAPTLRAEPAGIDLGVGTVANDAARRAIDVRNVSGAPTEVASVFLGGDHPGDFVVTSESCTGRSLNPGATCTVEVGFRPTSAHRRTASLSVATVGGEYTAAIVGGVGRYDPVLVSADASVVAGRSVGIALAGFPPDRDVAVSFDDSPRVVATVRTDAGGAAMVAVEIPRRERSGSRLLVATGADGVVATTPIRVVRVDPPAGMPGHGTG